MAAPTSPSAPDIPALLRFLTQDAKIPLAKAMASAKQLQSTSLRSPAAIAASKIDTLTPIFSSPDDAKRVLNAAKRVAKRATGGDPASSSSNAAASGRGRKRKLSPTADAPTPREQEESLALPEPILDADVLRNTVLFTNRAPLLLAFAVVLLKYTLPKQPLSSRLSLAQGMVSAGAREKAVYLGLEKGQSAEEEGFGMGQPVVRVMSRDIRVLKRWGYEVEEEGTKDSTVSAEETVKEEENGSDTNKAKEENADALIQEREPALWALDLEALKNSNGPVAAGSSRNQDGLGTGLPIYTPQSARSYLLKSFASAQAGEAGSNAKPGKGKKVAEEKEANLGLVLAALELLFGSWAETLGEAELNKRAWSWYVAVRPDVEHGVAGWGGKGEVRLARILSLRKQ